MENFSSRAIGGGEDQYRMPHHSLLQLFLRFLRFGALAWGGPVAQIAMIRQELVAEERWVGSERFNRVLALYQVLPGPEAHELCVYFGTLARGRWGGIVAGLGFMLPGFVLMLGLSWAYVRYGLQTPGLLAVFAAVQVAVAALVLRAVFRIGAHVMTDRWLWGIALVATVAHLAGIHFGFILGIGGLVYLCARRGFSIVALALLALLALSLASIAGSIAWRDNMALVAAVGNTVTSPARIGVGIGLLGLFWSGLKTGLLTFGGAYTAIPFLQRDAVTQGGWMSNAQFLDGLALSGLLPAPLIIFSTFVGYIGGGFPGAVLMTAGIFLPAFAFSLLGHDALERLVHRPGIRVFLEGMTAGVVGLIAGTTLLIMRSSLDRPQFLLLFVVLLAVLFRWNSKLATPFVILAAAAWGVLAAL